MAKKSGTVVNPETFDDRDLNNIAQMFKLASDVTRLKVVNHLHVNGEANVGGICVALGQSQPAVSHHLALLRVADVVESRRDGKNNFYSLTAIGKELAKVCPMFTFRKKEAS